MQFFFSIFFITVVVFLFIRSANKAFTTASFRGYSGFQVTWMIEWGQKSKPQKIIGPKINPPPPPPHQKKIHTQLRGRNTRANHESSVKSSHPRKFLPNFPTPKKSRDREFQTQKILRSSLSLENRRTPPPPLPVPHLGFPSTPNFLIKSFAYDVLHNRKQIIESEAESERSTSKKKQPRMGNEPNIFHFLETKIYSTRKRSTLNSGERTCCKKLKWVSHFQV